MPTISLSLAVDQLVISAITSGGGAGPSTGLNVGTGAPVYKDNLGSILRLRSIKAADSTIDVQQVGDEIQLAVLSTAQDWKREIFTVVTNGQVNFTLAAVAGDADTYELTVNGVEYARSVDFTVFSTLLTWLDVAFTLKSGDRVVVAYLA